MRRTSAVLFGIVLLAAVGWVKLGMAAESAADFYKKATVTFIVPNKAGGGYDTYARLIGPYLKKYTGSTVVIVNKAGGGGLVGMNMVYRAEPDGKTIGIANMTGSIPAQLAGAEGIDFDLVKYNWLARISDEPQVFVVGAKSKYKNWDEIIKSKQVVKLCSTGTTGATYLSLLVLKMVFDMQNVDIITGFKGTSDADLSVIRGEVDGTASSVGSKIAKIQEGDFKPLLLISDEKLKELPGVPLVYDFSLSKDGKAIADAYISMMVVARSLMTSPGVPADRVAFLREAFKKVLNDPEFVEKATKMQREVAYLGGEQVQKLVEKSMKSAPETFVKELKLVMK